MRQFESQFECLLTRPCDMILYLEVTSIVSDSRVDLVSLYAVPGGGKKRSELVDNPLGVVENEELVK